MSTVADVLRRVRNTLHDSELPYRWSDEELREFLNDGLAAIVNLKPEANVVEEIHIPPDTNVLQKINPRGTKFIKCTFNGELPASYIFLTSRVYPLETGEAMQMQAVSASARFMPSYVVLPEGASMSADMVSVVLDTILLTYEDWPAEGLDMSADMVGVTLS